MQTVKIIHQETDAVLSEFGTNNMTQKPSAGELLTLDELGQTYQVKQVEHYYPKVNCKRNAELHVMVL